MKQEEKRPQEFWLLSHQSDPDKLVFIIDLPLEGGLHVIEYSAYEQLKSELDRCKLDQIEFLTEHPTYKLSKELEAENEQLKAKLEKAKEALRFYVQPRRGAFLGSDSDYEFYPNHDVALDALKEIEGNL